MENLLAKDPNINVVYTINEPTAVGAYQALKKAGKDKGVLVVSVDGGCPGVKSVAEGVIGYDRIIKMLAVHDNELVVEEKGIYSIEKFLISRRLMYWQVYLHKTVLAAEEMLVQIMKRARKLSEEKMMLCSPALAWFLRFA